MAPRRREQIESGQDITFSKVFVPFYRSLVLGMRCNSIIEVGCGTGHLAKEFSQIAERVYALEPSVGMHSIAADVLRDSRVTLVHNSVEQYQATEQFDCAVSHLCAQAVTDLSAFLKGCTGLLNSNGQLIFSIPHPCFWNDYQRYFNSQGFDYTVEQFTVATLTISLDRESQMTEIPFNHRPLSRYVEVISQCGFAVDRFHEIFPTADVQSLYPKPWERPHFCVFQSNRRR
jgi:ubiquinone/menaquinone biosynthesis C-methylase UbiE